MRDIISEIWSTARRNKLRTTLTGFAVAWGIFMLVVLLGAGNGLIHALENNNNRSIVNSMADRKSTRLNSSHIATSRMPSSA